MMRCTPRYYPIDTAALRRLMGDASPEWYGCAFQRAYYRVLKHGNATGRTICTISDTLGIYPFEFVEEEAPCTT